MHRGWRRFRPGLRKQPVRIGQESLFREVRQQLGELLYAQVGKDWRSIDIEYLRRLTLRHGERLRISSRDSMTRGRQVELLVGLLLRTPGAARLQAQVDAHPRGYHHEQARIYELIDFNDSFVESVLALDPSQLSGFNEALRAEMSWFCKRLRTPMFSLAQFEAITRGLGREVAVYRGALEQGLAATMGSRIEDAKGVDMAVSNPLSGLSINIDCKTPSSYRYRLEDLIREGRITTEYAEKAEADDYCAVDNGEPGHSLRVVLFCVRPERYGEIVDFRFQDSEALGDRLRQIIAAEGR